ncbi:GntR family transcriptional regulator [Polycladidibacter stylochi]|uniref:GntR family transcriptional regulator n=1 Tax=Polycladidibacter stylochi TaxID=1807766 RepID=UPI0008353709|nr:GntR family transcriptional regulator [Pseudovibrio stylochi]
MNKSDRSNTAIAYRRLKEAIQNNQMRPGTQLLEREAAETLNMSRTPVREAMLLLQRDGLVRVRPRQGMLVLPITTKDIIDIYEILQSLEPIALKGILARGLQEEEVSRLQELMDLMDVAIEMNRMTVWAGADRSFHEYLLTLSENKQLYGCLIRLWDQSHRARLLQAQECGKSPEDNLIHRKVLAAVLEGNEPKAMELYQQKHQKARDTLLEFVSARKLEFPEGLEN